MLRAAVGGGRRWLVKAWWSWSYTASTAHARLRAPASDQPAPAAAVAGSAHPWWGGIPPGRWSRAPRGGAAGAGKLPAQRMADLLRLHRCSRRRCTNSASTGSRTNLRARVAPAERRPDAARQTALLPARRVDVASQLAADRSRTTTRRRGDRAHPQPSSPQVPDHYPLVLRQEAAARSPASGCRSPPDSAAAAHCCW